MAEDFELNKEMLDAHASLGGDNILHNDPHPKIDAYFPMPTQKQYKKGYIPRYFLVHYMGKVTEVSIDWVKDNIAKMPKIYKSFSIRWFISNNSDYKVELGMDSPRAADRNRFLVQKTQNKPLINYLGKNWEQFLS
tara:strand:+ start:471 stop:878 length:408 start_codon:yes stop_codon:yes gene_type:complete